MVAKNTSFPCGHVSSAEKCLGLKPQGQMEEPTIFIDLPAVVAPTIPSVLITHITFQSKKYCHRQGGSGNNPCFPPYNQLLALYRPSLLGKASFSGSSKALRLPLFRPSSSTEIAAAVNTPATPASMPPINVHLLLMVILLFSCVNAEGGITPAHCCRF